MSDPGFQSLCRVPERELALSLAQRARLDAAARARVETVATRLIGQMQQHADGTGLIARFLGEYRLSSAEGVVLLSLAEAFLRIPDTFTADLLIRDKLGEADWDAHLGRSSSTLVNAATVALRAGTDLISDTARRGILHDLVGRAGRPFVRHAIGQAMGVLGRQFVLGRTIDEALERARVATNRFRHSFDMLGEGARTQADAERYFHAYATAIDAIGAAAGARTGSDRPGISVKLSALHPRFEPAQRARVLQELVPVLAALAQRACAHDLAFTVDAEESERLELTLDVFAEIAALPALDGWNGLGLAVQAYQKRAGAVIEWLDALAARTGRRIPVRLVKGAYWDSEIKRTQERGLDGYPVFTRKAATDVSYLACARVLLAAQHLIPAFATHNALTVATLLEWAGGRRDVEFQRLHGMGAGLYESLLEDDPALNCRIYAPVGGHDDLLAYLVRRLLENGANSSFVNALQDPATPIDHLLADPADTVLAADGAPHPRIVLPRHLYGPDRLNAAGIDLTDRAAVDRLTGAMQEVWSAAWDAHSLIDGKAAGEPPAATFDPACLERPIGSVRMLAPSMAAAACRIGTAAQPAWNAQSRHSRARCLRTAADLLEARTPTFIAIAIREAGKTIPDALAEVREAVDFLRYYAQQAEQALAPLDLPGPTGETNRLTYSGRGLIVCISPWNFPLAIFIGQVSAALAAGNTVIAKPALQTSIIAHRAVHLLHEAGIPPAVLQLALGDARVGQALVAEPDVSGVVFTGSTAGAKHIERALAARDGAIVPLIAETGGQNAMIVDSSALPEQVIGDLITSAFLSAGQRCSAARVLLVQDEVADRIVERLIGAMDELRLGDPARLSTDIGPLIDDAARQRLQTHLEAMGSRLLHQLPAPPGGHFLGPALVALEDMSLLQAEVFGPVLHVVRWRAGTLDTVIDQINATGYGLTLGVHSRVDSTVERIRQRARAGNLYVNRSMVGAVVGVQPFGGEGLSGTGPKAGGPNYLKRLCTERVSSVDTTSAGGNASLWTLD
ncbi:MAG: bifunctional proline dehydrogenase/L-glutamate gamma-semialdehyde dehydrogenase PutA [bacterium]|jgi:RHH-type proline utilization regulon transcriptional repressor/proline dehydrogenase/delta 1-pyrroline-5-carboxylate dehydrogenase|nr:bifunctional proline dehydrogenase/L-glutamate gamma-semialdehyde dehydrogenase PutA [Betaproteobacteria bacterium]